MRVAAQKKVELAWSPHNLKVVGSNPTPATRKSLKYLYFSASLFPVGLFVFELETHRKQICAAIREKARNLEGSIYF